MLAAAPEGKVAEPLGQGGGDARGTNGAAKVIGQTAEVPKGFRIVGQRLGWPLLVNLVAARRLYLAFPFRSAEPAEQVLAIQATQAEQQKWIAVKLLTDQVINGSDVLAWVRPIRA